MLETFSGTVTLAQPHDLPEGASPRNQNQDFSVGSTYTRQGLENPFTYQDGSAGPDGGGNAVDTDLGGSVWANPGNTLLNTGVYATTTMTPPVLSITHVQVISGLVHFRPATTIIVTFKKQLISYL